MADAVVRLLRRRPTGGARARDRLQPGTGLRRARAACRRGVVSFADAQVFMLDEYVGLPAGHPQQYSTVIAAELTDHVDLPPGALHTLDAGASNIVAECERYEAAIAAAGGIDLQLLGIGRDGHIGFNEPGSSLGSRTRLKTLTKRTRADNARFFDAEDDVPRHVLTQGLATISEARHLVLIAAGAHKAAAVTAAVEGPVRPFCPASVLQLHPHVTVVLDEEAASGLRSPTTSGRRSPPSRPGRTSDGLDRATRRRLPDAGFRRVRPVAVGDPGARRRARRGGAVRTEPRPTTARSPGSRRRSTPGERTRWSPSTKRAGT